MAQLHLILAHDPALLLRHAADGFLDPPKATPEEPFPSPRYLLALRQGGLRDDVIRMAAEHGCKGWFDPPLCIFHELPERLGATNRRALGDFERPVLLGRILREHGRDVFDRLERPESFVDALDRLFGELRAEGISPDAYEEAAKRCRDRDDFQKSRDDELARMYRAYVSALDGAGRRDGRDAYIDVAAAVAADPEALAKRLRGRREVRFVGLQDLRGGWPALLLALRSSPAIDRVAIYSSVELDLERAGGATVTRLDEPVRLARRLFGGAPDTDSVDVIAAPDVEREVEEVALRVRELATRGVPLTKIAVVSREARPYVDLAVAALERFGVPATARRRIAHREVPVMRAVLALFEAAAEGWSRHGLVELAEQPYIGSELDATVLNFIGYRRRVQGLDGWRSALDELLSQCEERERRAASGMLDEDERRRPLPPSSRVRSARDAFAGFAAQARELDAARTLAEWIAWLRALAEDDGWGLGRRIYAIPDGRFDVARVDIAGWRGLRKIASEWSEAVRAWSALEETMDVAGFDVLLREMMTGDIPLWTTVRLGVQVLEGLAAAYRPFEHVFVIGLEAGRFPVRPPRSPVLDREDREALVAAGLPLELDDAWESRERELFRSLCACAGAKLTLSYARLDVSGREVIPSTFVDAVGDVAAVVLTEIDTSRVMTPGLPLVRSRGAAEHAHRAAKIERVRETGKPSRWNGAIEDPALVAWLAQWFGDDKLWSPTQLEQYAKCPWHYLATRLLGLEKLEDPSEQMEPIVRGSILHRALERFYRQAVKQVDGAPVLLRATEWPWIERTARRELGSAIDEAEREMWLGHPSLRPAFREELARLLLRYLAFEVQLNEDMFDSKKKKAPRMLRTGVLEQELKFEDVVLDAGGVRFRFRGTIDRVERGVDGRVASGEYLAAVDYKTTKWSTPGGGDKEAWDDDIVLQIPLYAHALEQIKPRATVARVEYRALKNRECTHSLELYRLDRSKTKLEPDPDAHEKMQGALAAVAKHVLAARRGQFPARPAESCGCPPWCEGWEICRVKGGPRPKKLGG